MRFFQYVGIEVGFREIEYNYGRLTHAGNKKEYPVSTSGHHTYVHCAINFYKFYHSAESDKTRNVYSLLIS